MQATRFREASAPVRAALIVVPALLFARALSADIGGVVANDSLGYLRRAAEDPFRGGLVLQGYRQVAMPLWVVLNDAIGDVTGWDRLFGVALAQRMILLLGVGLVWWALRWWSIPALIIITTPTLVAHTDLILPEGVLVPGTLVAAGLAAIVITERPLTRRYPKLAVFASGLTAFALSTIKLQYASLLCLTAAVAWTLWREQAISRRMAVTALAVPFALSAILAGAQAIENHDELGVYEPVSERARAEWYGAWVAIFIADLDNRTDPSLDEWFDGGSYGTFLKALEAEEPDYLTRSEVLRTRTDDMFAAAGTTRFEQFVDAFFGSLRAGRTDDVRGMVDRALSATPDDPSQRVFPNMIGRGRGTDAVLEEVNDGRPNRLLGTSAAFGWLGDLYHDYRPLKSTFAVIALLVVAVSLAFPGAHRPMSLGALGVIGSVSFALGTAYIDNARYLLGPFTMMLVAASIAVRGAVMHRRTTRA